MYVKHVKKTKWLDCQGNEFFPKQKGTPSLVKIEHKNTATLDSARLKKSKVAVLQLLIDVLLIYSISINTNLSSTCPSLTLDQTKQHSLPFSVNNIFSTEFRAI